MRVRSTRPASIFLSSRRRHTKGGRDWSSDVCSSDLEPILAAVLFSILSGGVALALQVTGLRNPAGFIVDPTTGNYFISNERSEERRVGKECRSRWSPYH